MSSCYLLVSDCNQAHAGPELCYMTAGYHIELLTSAKVYLNNPHFFFAKWSATRVSAESAYLPEARGRKSCQEKLDGLINKP